MGEREMKILFFRVTPDIADLIFRVLFSIIFIGLGMEHLFADDIILQMMPEWIPQKKAFSLLAGAVNLLGGVLIMIGYRIRVGALILGSFLIVVTLVIHAPALFHTPAAIPDQWHWLWVVFQRSSFVKNLCLLGVCFQLLHHNLGRYSLTRYLNPIK